MRKLIFIFILILGVTAIVSRVNAEMTGSSYKIRWDSVNTGGGEDISGSLYNLRSTMSEVGPGNSSGTTYNLRAGYRQAGMEIPFFYAELHAQDDSSQEAYSAFSNAGKTVTVADTTGYVVDDYIVVVENEGGSEMLAAGKIASVTPTVITVDKWSGDNATMSSSPAGGDDYVYELSTNTIALDTMITSVIQTGTAMVLTLTNAQNGYACTITEDGNFRTVNGDD
ncbi:hypothetical protein KKG19_04960, partial [Patescibacteria group bacterium]|nr:hypothetical protein [Patescibacteria group bacterium]